MTMLVQCSVLLCGSLKHSLYSCRCCIFLTCSNLSSGVALMNWTKCLKQCSASPGLADVPQDPHHFELLLCARQLLRPSPRGTEMTLGLSLDRGAFLPNPHMELCFDQWVCIAVASVTFSLLVFWVALSFGWATQVLLKSTLMAEEFCSHSSVLNTSSELFLKLYASWSIDIPVLYQVCE
jgi:hypothetical protein